MGILMRSHLAKYILVASLSALLILGAIVLKYEPSGFDYNAYNYFASLSFFGKNPYRAKPVPVKNIHMAFKSPETLDYTGLQQTIYNLCYDIKHVIWWRLDGFVLYSLVLFFLVVLTTNELYRRQLIATDEYIWFTILNFSPYVWYVLFFRSFEDKAIFILIPPALLLLMSQSYNLAALTLGLLTGLVGIPVLILPVLLVDAIREKGAIRDGAKLLSFFCLGLALSLIPYFPDAFIGWARRSALENSAPVWFSFWNLVDGLYFPGLNKLTIGVVCLGVYVLFFRRIISLKAAIVMLLSFPMFFSINMGSHRIVPTLVTLSIAFSGRTFRLIYAAGCAVCLLVFYFFDLKNGTFFSHPTKLNSAILLAPAAIGFLMLLTEAALEKRTLPHQYRILETGNHANQ